MSELLEDPSEMSYSWWDMAELTHEAQVARYNWCACEEQEEFPYDDCPRLKTGTWEQYQYVCSDCDALIEITTQKNIREWRGWCACGSPSLTMISIVPATIGDTA